MSSNCGSVTHRPRFTLDSQSHLVIPFTMPHRQRISPDSHWSTRPGIEFHEERRGWGKVSKTGKSILWEDYKPLTKRQIKAENKRRAKRSAWFKTPEGQAYIRKTDQFIDDMFARTGTSRAEMCKVICDVIKSAPPISSLFPSS